MTKLQLRSLWLQVHKWIGICLAIVFIPLSLTGSMLVWDEPLDRILQPTHYAATGAANLPPSSYIASARAALPAGSQILSLRSGDGPVMVVAAPPRPSAMRGPPLRLAAWVDPETGQVIDSGLSASPVLRWIHIFHGSLQIPGGGRAVVGWLGVAMLLSSLTGIWLWWPLTGSIARGFRWKRQPTTNANLHYLVGFWISVPLALLSATGAIIAWPQMIGSNSNPMRRAMQVPLERTNLTVDQAVVAAGTEGPVSITWPTREKRSWTVAVRNARKVEVDDRTGRATSAAGNQERGRPLYRRLHDGSGMGLVWQIIIFLGGVAPALLGVTGIIMWLRTRTWRAATAQRKANVRPG